jgi:hypothetical protein
MSPPPDPPLPDPRRVAAGRRNRAKRRGLTPAGRERLRQAALRHRPWEYATGPRTAAGKARAARNGLARRSAEAPAAEARGLLADLGGLARAMAAARRQVATRLAGKDAPLAPA